MTPEEIGDAVRSAPVPCVCGNRPTVHWVGSPLAVAVWVVCVECLHESGVYTTRAGALAGWAERVAKWQEEV